jgi:hypothetical protein
MREPAATPAKDEFYIVNRMGDDSYVLVGPRGQVATSNEELTNVVSDVPFWIHRGHPGARKIGLRGWRTLDGVLKSRAWRERATAGCRVTVAKLIEVGPPGEERDALETVFDAPWGAP